MNNRPQHRSFPHFAFSVGAIKASTPALLLLCVALLSPQFAHGQEWSWPTNQLLPTFATPATNLDCIDVSSVSSAESDLFASLEGIINRKQPRIACVVGGQEGAFTWLNLHNLPYTLINGYNAILKYRTNVTGLVVTDPAQPDTVNLATTIAGVKDQLICDPSLLATLTNAPYNLPVVDDLRGMFTDKYQVYRHLYTNYWPQCTHRLIGGMNPDVHGSFREYLVAVKSAVVWLDPATLNTTDRTVLAMFLSQMSPANSVYTGWWPSEANGLNWIYQYGVPVLASDFMLNASVFSGVRRDVHVPEIPPPPPLQNKVYVSLLLSDGDNIQYMQHAMKIRWDHSARGSIPIGWTVSPLALDMDPVMLDFYWGTATTNDCLVSGPSGAGYTHMDRFSSAHLTAFARISDSYLKRCGLRLITIWDRVNTGVARAFATNCPSLLGLTDQGGGNYTTVNLGLRTLGLSPAYSSSVTDIITGITNSTAARNWNGTAPQFVGAQGNVWDITPGDLLAVANALDTNKYVLVRPDHLFLLHNRIYGSPQAMTKTARVLSPGTATLEGFVVPKALNAIAWLEWGTNANYGWTTAITNVSGESVVLIRAPVTGLMPNRIYHFRVAVSNALGVVFGADRQFTSGGHVKAWGAGSLGQTNLPPDLTNAVAVAGGQSHGLALRNDGTVVGWGQNAEVPPGLDNLVEVAAGFQHSLALRSDGQVIAWGGNAQGQTNVPVTLSNVVAIAAGDYHNLALRSDGVVVAWGLGNLGQTNVPPGLSNVVGVAAGTSHSLALLANGSVTAWGANASGQTNVPSGLAHAIGISAAQNNSLVLKPAAPNVPLPQPASRWVADNLTGSDNSAVAAWNDVVAGKPATQNIAARQPRLFSNVLNGHRVVRFSSGSSQNLAVTSANSVITGAGSFTMALVFKTTTPGIASSLFYQNTGLLGCEQPNVVADWALCLNGAQLGAGLGAGGNGCGSDLSVYGGNVTDGKPHIALYVRAGDTLKLYVDGVLVASRTSLCTAPRGNYNFQIGAMTASSLYFNGDIAEIQMFNEALNSAEIVRLNEVLAAIYGVTTGSAWPVAIWGDNANGQLSVPVSVTNIVAAVSRGSFNLALSGNDRARGWGNNAAGQLNIPVGLTNIAALAGGGAFSLAIADQTPSVNDTTVSGYVNHDLAINLPGVDPDGYGLDFRVLALPTSGALYQSVNGTRGNSIDATNTLVTDPNGHVIFAPAPNASGEPYTTFSFTADNGFYAANVAQVTVNITSPASPLFTSALWNQENPSSPVFELAFTGSANVAYGVWASTNLSHWDWIGPATETSSGNYSYSDAAAATWPQRFYRVSGP